MENCALLNEVIAKAYNAKPNYIGTWKATDSDVEIEVILYSALQAEDAFRRERKASDEKRY